MYLRCIFWVSAVFALPSLWIDKVADNIPLTEGDNRFPRYDEHLDGLTYLAPQSVEDNSVHQEDGTEWKWANYTEQIIPFSTNFSEEDDLSPEEQKQNNKTTPRILKGNSPKNVQTNANRTLTKSSPSNETVTTPASSNTSNINPIANNPTTLNETRIPRQDSEEKNDSNEQNGSKNENDSRENASQEESSEEEEGNMVTGLISSFLSGLSTPEGGIDVEAIIGLLGSLSTQNPDGTYEFSGLTELLRSFFGGEGGSDVGAFTGGILGAVIRGFANPPGGKGAGIFTGKVVAGLLPALSGPATTEGETSTKYPPKLDSGSFLTGFLKTLLNSGGNSTQNGYGGRNSKYNLVKGLFSLVTGVFTAASSLSSKSDWN
ncbi:uncharacterized protein LOC132704939 isoform X2 [Cylas formicarius]|uniref:uncharacterized protein LOC132704939 isoform X2 n=1 Tax=Cylas formicarius TaxID=197179 RepID=UPI0029587A0F|nr:uncharacterized protein LOC132704939 isoform X2 [Cylas formicarius]